MMKKLLPAALFVCALLPVFAQNDAQPRLAVVAFTVDKDAGQTTKREAVNIREQVRSNIVRNGGYVVIARAEIDKILNDQKIAVSSIAEDENLKKLRLLQISYLVTGIVGETTGNYYRVVIDILDVANGQFANSSTGLIPIDPVEQDRGIAALVNEFLGGMKSDSGRVTISGTTDVIPTVIYQSHVQGTGWQAHTANGGSSGTTGQSRRLEAFRIRVDIPAVSGGIRYSAHVAGAGWQDFVSNDAIAGTTGKSRAIEAIRIELTGDLAVKFDVYYRAHVTGIGWMDWVLNGITAGTTGQSRHIEAFQVVLTKKNEPGPR